VEVLVTVLLARGKIIDAFVPMSSVKGWSRWGSLGTDCTTRRAVRAARAAWCAGHRRSYRPRFSEPGIWLQFDWGARPLVPRPDGRARPTWLLCAWLAWSRFRVVVGVRAQDLDAGVAVCCDG